MQLARSPAPLANFVQTVRTGNLLFVAGNLPKHPDGSRLNPGKVGRDVPQTIEGLEREQKELFQAMGDPGLYKKDRADIVATNDRLEELKRLLAEAYERWEELEQLRLDMENRRLSK